MSDPAWLASEFEARRGHLHAVAYRMLGSADEADDAVQEAWLRLSRSNADEVDNLGGWLTTVVARICLDHLRARTSRREDPLDAEAESDLVSAGPDPEAEAMLAESLGPALLAVLDLLSPGERLAFVLHDLFGVPFDEVATVLATTPAAARQLASRGRRRVRGADSDEDIEVDAALSSDDLGRRRAVVEAFLRASRQGDLAGLVALLHPDVALTADPPTVASGAEPEVHGAEAVAATFAGRARAARPALLDGHPGLAWTEGGQPRVVFRMTIEGERITAIDLISDPAAIARMDVVLAHG